MNKPTKQRLLSHLTGLTSLAISATAQAIVINEVRTDQPGPDNDEYFELAGIAGESLNDLSYLVLGDSRRGKSGVIESVTRLTGFNIAADGYFLAAESSFSLGDTPEWVTSLNFENNDNVTHMLVRGFSAQIGDDLDLSDNGLLDITPWTDILDSLALVKSFTSGDKIYSSTQIGNGNKAPVHAYRSPDNQGKWLAGTANTTGDTAGRSNSAIPVPEPTTLTLLALGMLMYRYKRTG